ncbi:MAG: AAA family ATPase [bacterium]|nr:AAA family ATPase [bacterium]
MTIDKNEFFREATLRICGNLEIDRAMHACFEYIGSIIPLDTMYMELFEQDFGSMRVIAKTTKEESMQMDLLVPLSRDAKNALKTGSAKVEQLSTGPVWMVNDPDIEPITKGMLGFLGEKKSSVLGMLLIITDKPIGSLICLARGKDRYDNSHQELLALLREPFYIALSNALAHREVTRLKDMLIDDNRYLQRELMNRSGDNIIGSNFGLKGVMEMVRQVADPDSPVLLLGETGTGKDLIANAVHYSSSRHDGPFISVNCGAIPESLIDSELFGHEKGAFTGALTQKRGRFERAHQGTIFLDEVGELPPQVQVRLLRVLQNREIERVGGTKTIALDIRIITATNRNLEEMVRENLFREDLWFRLNVFPIVLPPLRERKSDIPALLQHFLLQKARELKLLSIPELEPGSIEILMKYSWPGNVRELENVIERALILNRNGPVGFKHLQQTGKRESVDFKEDMDSSQSSQTLDEVISRHIQQVLLKTNGKIHGPGGAAELLGVNASTLRNRMNKLGIEYGHSAKKINFFF